MTPSNLVQLGAIALDPGARVLERGIIDTLTATATDLEGDTVVVPVVWRSSNERVAVFRRGGVLLALDTGTTVVTASSLGVSSPQVGFQIVWQGASKIAVGAWTPPNARSPGVALTDSIRVVVTNIANAPVANASVNFNVTAGGGTVSPATVTTGPTGVAAARWTLGPAVGRNVVTASVVRSDGTPDSLVSNNLVSFTINSYNALTVQSGNNQTALLRSDLPDQPSVKLVDSLGAPRAGVPVSFTVFANGRVATPVVSTGADGIASPGKWTLGDVPGEQTLEARVEDAKVSLSATATGTPIYYEPAAVVAGGFSTCALEANGSIKCWGEIPLIGTGDTVNVSVPTPVQGSLVAAVLAGGPTSNCALTSQGLAWCWGLNALVDTTGAATGANVPTKLQSAIAWLQFSPGYTHNCGVSLGEIAYCWGNNNTGQLGDGTLATRFVLRQVSGGFKFSQIASGSGHSCALTNGIAYCWGLNSFGQVGDGTTQTRTGPTLVLGGLTFQSIAAGEVLTCGLTLTGRAYCWGGIANGTQTAPITYPGAPTLVSLTVGGGHACGLTTDASAYCWGSNSFGQLGDSTTVRRNEPTKVAGNLRFSRVSPGYLHTCGLTTNGAVACWGLNRGGELGDSTVALNLTPRRVVLGVNP